MKQLSQNCDYKDVAVDDISQSVLATEIDLPYYLSRMEINMIEFYIK